MANVQHHKLPRQICTAAEMSENIYAIMSQILAVRDIRCEAHDLHLTLYDLDYYGVMSKQLDNISYNAVKEIKRYINIGVPPMIYLLIYGSNSTELERSFRTNYIEKWTIEYELMLFKGDAGFDERKKRLTDALRQVILTPPKMLSDHIWYSIDVRPNNYKEVLMPAIKFLNMSPART
jgi:hypothetical protein